MEKSKRADIKVSISEKKKGAAGEMASQSSPARKDAGKAHSPVTI